MNILNKIKKILIVISKIILIIILLMFLPYLFSSIYDFPNPKPFSGQNFYNPYSDTIGTWYKANFQAHSGAWGGITNGKISPKELYDSYKNLGYEIIGITNYQLITPLPVPGDEFIPAYEHGYNIMKRHHLCIGAKSVVWMDYLFFQTIHHKQDIINRIRPTTEILAISHPKFSNSFLPSDFTMLTGIDFLEILNHYRLSLPHWDSALSAGKVFWGLGDDDSHDQTSNDETGRYWTMIFSKSKKSKDVLTALKLGQNYCVSGWHGHLGNKLKSIKIDSNFVNIEMDSLCKIIRFIGQYGDTLFNSFETNKALYKIKNSDRYIRIEAVTDTNTFYFNPVFRYSNNPFSYESAEVNIFYTWIYRFGIIITYFAIIKIVFFRRKKRKN